MLKETANVDGSVPNYGAMEEQSKLGATVYSG